ncbi:MAG TPA: MBL fold metallo-hydrolase [Gemmatimonadales bacterium]|nr:MBL fold metallo-hydrolase [Gemmatimonadales bacterium]
MRLLLVWVTAAGGDALAPPLLMAQGETARVVMLGTGTPNPDPERSGPALAVVVNGTAYLVDAGPGIMRRAEQASRNGIAALQPSRLRFLFLSHLHSDHTVGLPDLIHTGWVAERESPLEVRGPRGTAAMARHLTEAWAEDIRVRTEGSQPHTPNGWKVEATDVGAGVVFRDSNITVTAFRVPHTGWPEALGYRFEARGRVIVVSGDTRPSDALAAACNGCDVLVHEVYSAERFRSRPPEWQRYHAGSHTSTVELAALAARARPRLLVLYHQLYWGATDEDLVREIRAAGYTGAVVSAKDLAVY